MDKEQGKSFTVLLGLVSQSFLASRQHHQSTEGNNCLHVFMYDDVDDNDYGSSSSGSSGSGSAVVATSNNNKDSNNDNKAPSLMTFCILDLSLSFLYCQLIVKNIQNNYVHFSDSMHIFC